MKSRLNEVRQQLLAAGIIISHQWLCATGWCSHVEYRVNFRGGKEATAYYTEDLDDALATGLAMAAHRAAQSEAV